MEVDTSDRFKWFINKHQKFLLNPLIHSFLAIPKNNILLKMAVCFPTMHNKNSLNIAFKKFYSNIRLISYLSTVIYRRAVNFDKRIMLSNHRLPLILDQPVYDSNSKVITYSDIFISLEDRVENIVLTESRFELKETIEDIRLLQALKKLTPCQKQITEWTYFHNLTSKEIAQKFKITRQAVYKTRKKALEQLRIFIEKGRD